MPEGCCQLYNIVNPSLQNFLEISTSLDDDPDEKKDAMNKFKDEIRSIPEEGKCVPWWEELYERRMESVRRCIKNVIGTSLIHPLEVRDDEKSTARSADVVDPRFEDDEKSTARSAYKVDPRSRNPNVQQTRKSKRKAAYDARLKINDQLESDSGGEDVVT